MLRRTFLLLGCLALGSCDAPQSEEPAPDLGVCEVRGLPLVEVTGYRHNTGVRGGSTKDFKRLYLEIGEEHPHIFPYYLKRSPQPGWRIAEKVILCQGCDESFLQAYQEYVVLPWEEKQARLDAAIQAKEGG
ncbi:MAG: hypothetical protein AAF555_11405 [Verrucomicrobiota bacterium]